MSSGFHRQKLKDAQNLMAQLNGSDHRLLSSHSMAHDHAQPWAFNIDAIDDCLPEKCLSQAALHEIEPLRPTEMPALTGFAFGMLSRLKSQKPIIWCVTREQVGDYGNLYAFGLERYGIAPSRIIFSKVSKSQDLHFAMEEALKTKGVAAVLGEGKRPNFTGSRRLSLLCQTHQTPCLFLVPHADIGGGSAAQTRFQITPEPGQEDPRDPYGPGLPTWRLALPRSRNGRAMPEMPQTRAPIHQTPYPWRIVWDDQTLSFHLPALLSRGAVSQGREDLSQDAQAMVGRRSTG